MTIFLILIISLIILISFLYWQNNDIVVTQMKYSNSKIPKEFDNYTIVQVSDLHDTEFGEGNIKLLDKIRATKPDIIVITGDLIYRYDIRLDISMRFIEETVKMAPVYFITGNHEAWSEIYDEIKIKLLSYGVKIIDDVKEQIVRDGNVIEILGVQDPAFYNTQKMKVLKCTKLENTIKELNNNSNFKILLSHRPELIEIYAKTYVDVVFTGHAHGGQIRLPLIGGILAPNQGFFPKYTKGKHVLNNTCMIVSRGLGKSAFPFRIFNRPELIVLKLYNEEK